MQFDPTDWRTWSRLDDHPVFGRDKRSIMNWSLDPTQYCDLDNYSQFMPERYVHVDPAPPVESQRAIATRDMGNLAASCDRIIQLHGPSDHEIVVLDDFTVFVWLRNEHFMLTIYPLQLEGEYTLMLNIDLPIEIDEIRCKTIDELMQSLGQEIVG